MQVGSSRKMMNNQPCYQVYSSFEYQMKFNNQNYNDEIATKLLLLLPMLPVGSYDNIKLNHLRLIRDDSSSLNKSVATGQQILLRQGNPLNGTNSVSNRAKPPMSETKVIGG